MNRKEKLRLYSALKSGFASPARRRPTTLSATLPPWPSLLLGTVGADESQGKAALVFRGIRFAGPKKTNHPFRNASSLALTTPQDYRRAGGRGKLGSRPAASSS